MINELQNGLIQKLTGLGSLLSNNPGAFQSAQSDQLSKNHCQNHNHVQQYAMDQLRQQQSSQYGQTFDAAATVTMVAVWRETIDRINDLQKQVDALTAMLDSESANHTEKVEEKVGSSDEDADVSIVDRMHQEYDSRIARLKGVTT